MKGRESGMPAEDYWESFFDPDSAMAKLLPAAAKHSDVVELGCGYGTFTLPTARMVTGVVTALDIEPEMLSTVERRARRARLENIRPVLRDFVADRTGLPDGSQGHAMIFNLLHLDQPVSLLREARRVLANDGSLSVMHWRSDIPTPRGPSLSIRPSPEQCAGWLLEAGFRYIERLDLAECCPYHYGMRAWA